MKTVFSLTWVFSDSFQQRSHGGSIGSVVRHHVRNSQQGSGASEE